MFGLWFAPKIIPSDDYYYYFYVFVSLKLRWHKAHYEGTKAWMRFVCAVKKKAVKYYVCIYGIFRFGRTLKWCFKCISSEYVGFMATLEIEKKKNSWSFTSFHCTIEMLELLHYLILFHDSQLKYSCDVYQ